MALALFPRLAHAHAQAADPLGVAGASVDGGISLLVTYGPLIGSMYLVYQLASRLVARRAESSILAAWFAKGKRLAIATSALGIAGAAVQAQVSGASWAGIVLAAIAAAFKLVTPTVGTTATAGTARAPQAGRARLLVLLALAGAGAGAVLVGAVSGCASGRSDVKADAEKVLDGAVVCAKADIPAVKALGLQLATEALASVFAGHGIPWSQLEDEAAAAAKIQGISVASCAFGDLIAQLARLLPPPASTGAASAAAAGPDPLLEGRAALGRLKIRLGVTAIDTGAGVL